MSLNARPIPSTMYELLEALGVSERVRLLSRNTAVIYELMHTISALQLNFPGVVFVSGSRYEGSFLPGMMPDLDIVLLNEKVFLEASKVHLSLIVVQDEYVHPGYVKLQLSLNGQPQTLFNNTSFKPNLRYELDCRGRICYKGIHTESMNGPAVPVFDQTQKHSFDFVSGKFSDNIPYFAQEWLGRKRKYGWPSDQQVKEMMGMGCVYVYVGHEWSAEAVVEWRLSFTRQERLLMTSLNSVQHKVFVLLKIIKKNIIQPKFDTDVLTSYHCKTCILFMAETTPRKSWIADKIVVCLLACLKTLNRWVTSRFCPNFFMKEQNLFAKTVFRRNGHKLAQTLKELIDLDTQIVAFLCQKYFKLLLIDMDELMGNVVLQVNLIFLPLFSIDVYLLCAMFDRDIKSASIFRLLRYFQRTERITFHTIEETRLAVSYCKSYANFYLGRALLSEFLTKPTESNEKYHISNAYYYLSLATQTGQVSVRLFLASFLFSMRNYKKCSAVLRSVETDLEVSTYHCICNMKSFYVSSSDIVSLYWKQPLESILGKVERCIVVFPHEREIIPLAFQLEMFRTKDHNQVLTDYTNLCNAVVDPYSFLYFMQYLIGLALNRCVQKKNALSKLNKLTNGDRAFHREATYNLLGWVYIQENQIGTAMQCFMESWKIRPNYNAAKLHVNSLSSTFHRLICKWQKS